MANPADDNHWVISVQDRAKHNAQFEQLKPVNGLANGDQVKPLLMKSGLPMPVLGHVWNLADINGDGKLDQLEFSIAIHLIRKRLQGVALPKVLPASLKAEPVTTPSPPPAQPPSAPAAAPAPAPAPAAKVASPVNAAARTAAVTSPPTAAVTSPPTVGGAGAPATSGMQPSAAPSANRTVTSPPSVVSPPRPAVPQSRKSPEPSASPVAAAVATVTAASSKPSGEQNGAALEWAISQAEYARYIQMFHSHDQKKKGYLTGLEARDILSQSGLSVKLLAQIWNLADIDGDGRLTKDEFCVAMYYVDMAKSGKPVPASIPPEVIPPACRKPPASTSQPEKPVSLPRPTSKPPSDVTRVPAIQPPSVAAVRRQSSASATPPSAAASSKPPNADPFGMDPMAFDSTVPLLDAPLIPAGRAAVSKEAVAKEASSPVKELPVAPAAVDEIIPVKSEPTSKDARVLSPPPATSSVYAETAAVESKNADPVVVEDKQHVVSEAEKIRQLEAEAEEHRRALQEQLEREKEEQRKKLQEQLEKEKEEQRRLLMEQLEKEKEAQRKLLLEQMEKEKEEQRRKLIEQKEAAKREMERQRQLEWEQQRKVQLEMLKLKEVNLVERLEREVSKVKVDLASLDDRRAELSGKADKARNVVSDFTSAIEQMRLVRDQKMADINRVQLRIEDCNKRVLTAEQDQVQLNMQLQTFKQCHADAFKVMVNSCNTKKAVVDQLKEQLMGIEKDTTSRLHLIDSNCSKISELKQIASDLYAEIKLLEDDISLKRADWIARRNADNERLDEKWRHDSESTEKGQVSLEGYNLYTAMYEFTARSDDELSLQPGDMVWIKPENIGTGTGWTAGRMNDGREGCFPESYVQLADEASGAEAYSSTAETTGTAYDEASATVTSVSEATAAESQAGEYPTSDAKLTYETDARNEEVTNSKTFVDSADKPADSAGLYVAVYAFTSSEDGDLTFNAGDVISVTRCDGDWWTGCIGNKSGIFPANFVKKMDSQPPAAAKEDGTQKATAGKKPEIATVIAPYEPTSAEQLALQVGQMILIRRKTDGGWWEGELQARGQKRRVGWFPANFVKVLGPGGSRLSAEASGKIPTQQPPQSATAAATSAISSAQPAAPAASAGGVKGTLEQAIALYDYQSQHADELGFVKGNVINVLSKEHPDWWMGELNGRTGIFPANFVGPSH